MPKVKVLIQMYGTSTCFHTEVDKEIRQLIKIVAEDGNEHFFNPTYVAWIDYKE